MMLREVVRAIGQRRAPATSALLYRAAAAPVPQLGLGKIAPRRPFCSFHVNFVSSDGETVQEVMARSGQTILEVAHEHDIDIEGACGGECACSTCHVIFTQEGFDSLPEPDDDEIDMLDLAAHVCDTSRLGCCVKLMKGRDEDLRIMLPAGAANLLS
mmetsp:Transcript_142602/g.273913  ORF Transcript_142602/g.273913 Transcript_142602/m.273913 type:complete len:157 (+) Transcript_142602:85-555(+)